MNNKIILGVAMFMAFGLSVGCTEVTTYTSATLPDTGGVTDPDPDPTPDPEPQSPALYTSYDGLTMIGYQGWFNTAGDGMGCNWTHYTSGSNEFVPGRGNISIEFWPDMEEYPVQYITPWSFSQGQYAGQSAYLFSSADYSTTNLHFQWMEEYGLDGVFLQRFLTSVINSSTLKAHRNHVTGNVLRAAAAHGRAWSLMYDLSGSTSDEYLMNLYTDLEELDAMYNFSDPDVVPNYLHHNGKPLLAIWGVGFTDDRSYTIDGITALIERIQADGKFSILLGVPYYWRGEGGNDSYNSGEPETYGDQQAFFDLIADCDMIMPWAVGRYKNNSLDANIAKKYIENDLAWLATNAPGVDYAPLIFPGTSTGNLKGYEGEYNGFPRDGGDFMWNQVWNAYNQGAESLYIAMFDEVDEGTAIFKCLNTEDLPDNGDDGMFIGIDDDLETDHYLWLTGEATNLFHGETAGYTASQPTR